MRLNRFSVVPVLICLLAFAVHVWHLPYPQFSGDEGFTYLLASLSYSDLAHKIIEIGEPQPIGSFFLEKFWLDMGGGSEFNLRLLNVCFGVLAVAMMWRLFRSANLSGGAANLDEVIGSKRHVTGFTGTVAAALILTFNPFGLDHSREYRTYAMALALSLACMLALLAYVQRPHWRQALLVGGVRLGSNSGPLCCGVCVGCTECSCTDLASLSMARRRVCEAASISALAGFASRYLSPDFALADLGARHDQYLSRHRPRPTQPRHGLF